MIDRDGKSGGLVRAVTVSPTSFLRFGESFCSNVDANCKEDSSDARSKLMEAALKELLRPSHNHTIQRSGNAMKEKRKTRLEGT